MERWIRSYLRAPWPAASWRRSRTSARGATHASSRRSSTRSGVPARRCSTGPRTRTTTVRSSRWSARRRSWSGRRSRPPGSRSSASICAGTGACTPGSARWTCSPSSPWLDSPWRPRGRVRDASGVRSPRSSASRSTSTVRRRIHPAGGSPSSGAGGTKRWSPGGRRIASRMWSRPGGAGPAPTRVRARRASVHGRSSWRGTSSWTASRTRRRSLSRQRSGRRAEDSQGCAPSPWSCRNGGRPRFQ